MMRISRSFIFGPKKRLDSLFIHKGHFIPCSASTHETCTTHEIFSYQRKPHEMGGNLPTFPTHSAHLRWCTTCWVANITSLPRDLFSMAGRRTCLLKNGVSWKGATKKPMIRGTLKKRAKNYDVCLILL